MPLFGMKKGGDQKGSGGKAGGSSGASPSTSSKTSPTVEDKYTMKDVLGT